MGAALVGGLLEGGWEADALSIAEIDAERRVALEQLFPKVRVVPSAAWAVADADVVVLAVKPGDVAATLDTALPALGADTLVLSIAAGVTIAQHRGARSRTGRSCARCRTRPRSSVSGASAIAGGTPRASRAPRPRRASARRGRHRRAGGGADARRGHRPLRLGAGVRLPRRRGDDRGGRARRPRPRRRGRVSSCRRCSVRRRCSRTTVRCRSVGPEGLRAAVTSPGGTTAAGLRELEAHGSAVGDPRRGQRGDAAIARARRRADAAPRETRREPLEQPSAEARSRARAFRVDAPPPTVEALVERAKIAGAGGAGPGPTELRRNVERLVAGDPPRAAASSRR